jgi:hypothetical protein
MSSNETPNRPRGSFGPGGFAGKVALATLALVLLFVIVGGIVLATHLTRREVTAPPNAEMQQP